MIKLTQPRAIAGAVAVACLCLQGAYAQTSATAPAPTNTPAGTAPSYQGNATTANPSGIFPGPGVPTPEGIKAGPDATNAADPIVAKGKGVEIKRSTLDESLMSLRIEAAARGQSIPEDMKADVESDVVHGLIFKALLASKATAEDKAKAKKETDEYLASVRTNFPSEEAFQNKLKATGMTLDQLQSRRLEEAVCVQVLDREVKSKVNVSDADVKKFYDDNPSEFEMPERVRASHILISTLDKATQEPLPLEQKKVKEKLARDIKARAEKGEDFAKLAKEYSEDPGSKDTGGEYTFGRGEMVKEFEAAAFSLKTNQVSDLVETRYGYHIIKLSEKLPAAKVDFAKVSPKIKDYLIDTEIRKQLPDYRAKLEKEAGVQLFGIKEPAAPADEKSAGTNAPAAPVPAAK